MSENRESTSHVMNVGGCESLLKSQRCGYGIQVIYFKVNIEWSFCGIQIKITQRKWSCCLCNVLLSKPVLKDEDVTMPQIRQGVSKAGFVITPDPPFPYSSGEMARQVSETLSGDEESGSTVNSLWNRLSWAIHCFCLIQDIYLLVTYPTSLNRLFFPFLMQL